MPQDAFGLWFEKIRYVTTNILMFWTRLQSWILHSRSFLLKFSPGGQLEQMKTSNWESGSKKQTNCQVTELSVPASH